MDSAGSQVHPTQLLRDHVAAYRNARGLARLGNTALRHHSLDARELLEYYAAERTGLVDEVRNAREGDRRSARALKAADLDPEPTLELARVLIGQCIRPDDADIGSALFDMVLERFGPDRIPGKYQTLHCEIVNVKGDYGRLRELLSRYKKVFGSAKQVFSLNLVHPYADRQSDWSRWFRQLQRMMPPAAFTMSEDVSADPIDRLSAAPLSRVDDDTLVTVVVTSYQPGPELVTAVQSLTDQSWTNLEILLVDDGSDDECLPVLKSCQALDDRVKLVRMPVNSGTYAARNLAMDTAAGEFITFQDSDDWSHPDRILRQVGLMRANPSWKVLVGSAIKLRADLLFSRFDRPNISSCYPTTMFRLQEVRDRIGYFHQLRKSADGEYLRRAEAVFGDSAVAYDKDEALVLMRQGGGSLSRSDFGPGGWMHPAREAYQFSYARWHQRIKERRADPYVGRGGELGEVKAPRYLNGNRAGATSAGEFDYVWAGDWRQLGGPAKSMLEEIGVLARTGKRLGILQLDAYRFASQLVKPLCEPIQKLINEGLVERVLPTEDTHVSTLIVRYPPVLQFRRERECRIRADRVFILANQTPRELDGSQLRYVGKICARNAERMFGVAPIWVPQGPQTRRALIDDGTIPPDRMAEPDMPSIVEVSDWAMVRSGFRSDLPVIGRHSRDHPTKWPSTERDLLAVYPDDPAFDVRTMGGADSALQVLGRRSLPSNWINYGYDEVSIKSFLYQLDFWVYFHHEILVESFGRAILEAMASGCVIILPPHFEPTFGQGAVYCTSGQVRDVIREIYDDVDSFHELSARGVDHVREHFSHESHLRRMAFLEERY